MVIMYHFSHTIEMLSPVSFAFTAEDGVNLGRPIEPLIRSD